MTTAFTERGFKASSREETKMAGLASLLNELNSGNKYEKWEQERTIFMEKRKSAPEKPGFTKSNEYINSHLEGNSFEGVSGFRFGIQSVH